jgi:Zn-dependent peptidase ImmA (M78 family)
VQSPIPVDSIAEDLLGLRVAERDGLACSGMLVPWRREILLNAAEAKESAGRRRFTVAHEIGHWICHCLEGSEVSEIHCRSSDVATDAPPNPREREANVFAAELLMPEAEVFARHRDGLTPAEMAESFGVSELALRWRLYNFHLIDEPPAPEGGES